MTSEPKNEPKPELKVITSIPVQHEPACGKDLYIAVHEFIDLHDDFSLEQVLDVVLSAALDSIAGTKAENSAVDARVEAGASVDEAIAQVFETDRFDVLHDMVMEIVGTDDVQDRLDGLRDVIASVLHKVSDEVVAEICPDCFGLRGKHSNDEETLPEFGASLESKEVSSDKATGALHVVP